jgi:CO/xanthine dehydrogenase FAD-binding subunit
MGMMNHFPRSLQEALEIRSFQAVPYAGGTDLVTRGLQAGQRSPFPGLMFLHLIPELGTVTREDHRLRIGPMVTMSMAAAEDLLPVLLRRACAGVGSPALRNQATLGGNVCTASPAGDGVCALYACGADVRLQAVDRERTMPLEEFIIGPGKTVLAEDELLTGIFIPPGRPDVCFHRKVCSRMVNAVAKVSVSGAVFFESDRIVRVRMALGAVGPTVIRCRDTEAAVIGLSRQKAAAMAKELGRIAAGEARPIDDTRSSVRYRRQVVGNLVQEFFETL